MRNYKLPLLFTALLLTACGGEKQETANEELQQGIELPAEGTGPELSGDDVIEPTEGDAVIDADLVVPSNLKIANNGNDISLKWGYIPQATAYKIYYNEGEAVDQSGVVFTTSQTRFTHQGLSKSLHSYKVQAVYDNGRALSDLSTRLQADLTKPVKIED